jgi:hypothetical protein
VKRPASDFLADARQRLWTGGGLEAVREDARLVFRECQKFCVRGSCDGC